MSNKEANLRRVIGKKVGEASLSEGRDRDTTPNVRQDGDFANTPYRGGQAFEREEPPKDHMRRYWRQYETTPLIREPINTFAQQVVEPGYRVVVESNEPESERAKPDPEAEVPDPAPGEADEGEGPLTKKERKKLEEWLENCAIIEKEPDKDIRHMLKKAVVQREVRGTALIEKVYATEDSDKLYGLAFLNAETVRPNTRPGQPLLLLPNDKPSDFDVDGEFPITDDGETAAYTQYTTSSGYSTTSVNDEDVNNFSINDVIKLTRDADVNEAWGTSRLEAISAEIEGLKNKMRDQNEAIASKAYPLWLFLFGSEEQPWDADDIDRFMQSHEMDEFHPGMKQGVRGDVDIETISGEVADIIDYLQFDVDYIMSSMPLPKYSLGAFEANINQFVTKTQERQTERQLKEARRELEAELSEVVQQKANEMFDLGDNEIDKIKFKLGHVGEEYEKQRPNTTNINYDGKDDDGPQGGADSGDSGSSSNDSGASSTEENTVWDVELSETDGECVDGECSTEELADPRLVGTADVESDLAGLIGDVMVGFREDTLDQLRTEYEDAPYAASMAFEDLANTRLNGVFRDENFTDNAEAAIQETVQRTLDTLEQDNQSVTLDTNFGYGHRQNANRFAQSVRDETRDALDELASRMDRIIQRGANNGESLDAILTRVRNAYDEENIRQRAQLLSRMAVQESIENTKLTEFERADEVTAVKVVNPCTDATTPLCEHLAGCGPRDGAIARFDADKSLSEQWQEQVNSNYLFKNFTPLPPAPPFHFNCRSGLIPLSGEQLEAEQPTDDEYTVSELEEKYGIEVTDE